MPSITRFLQFASLAVMLSLSDGRSDPAPEPVTRFRAVEGYNLFITVTADEDMKVDNGAGESMQRKFKERFVARIDLTERHLDNDYVEWTGEGDSEQILEQTDKEIHFAGNFVQEVKRAGRGRSKTKVRLYIDELQRTFQVYVDAEYIPGTESGSRNDNGRTEQISGETSLVTTGLRWMGHSYPLSDAGLGLFVDKPFPYEECGEYLKDFEWALVHFEHAHLGRIKLDLLPLGTEPKLLTPPDASIHADPGGPYSFERSKTITLNGTRSVPSKGHRLQSYEWELTPLGTPDGCSGIGAKTKMTGPTVTFVALCSLTAELTVKDDGGKEDHGQTGVTVTVRPWKTELTTDDQIKRENFTFVTNGFVFGYNRCNRPGHFDEHKNHWYEPRAGSTNDYEEGTFWLDQVNDSGPFAGTFFVRKGDFKIPRALWVNKKLYPPNGEVYELNPGPERDVTPCSNRGARCSFGKPVIDRLRRSVEVHEKLHSTLASRALGARKDPAKDLESSMTMDRTTLKDRANGFLISTVSDMNNASSESNVKANMPAEFKPGGCIDFPDWDSAVKGGCYYYFASFADK